MQVVSWNVNSLKARLAHVLRFLDEHTPDVLCLQETKQAAGLVEANAEFSARGYHVHAGGTRGYAGVATLSKRAIQRVVHGFGDTTEHADRRVLCHIDDVWIDNVYVPTRRAIGKSEFLDALTADYGERFDVARDELLLCGDFNICFDERDLATLKLIAEPERFGQRPEDLAWRRTLALGLHDCLRKHQPEQKLFTWFPLAPWAIKRNYGMRLDYVFASAHMFERCSGVEHALDTRRWERPSDHVPVIARFG